jgi:hypothetical protein
MPPTNMMTHIANAKTLTPEIEQDIDKIFTFKKWTDDEEKRGTEVRNTLANAVKMVVKNVPPGQMRTRAINNIVDARMLCNAAITFGGQA